MIQHSSALVGREALLAGIEEVLRGESLTGVYVSGVTGSGKSVLARTLAEELGGDEADNRMAVRIMVSQIVWDSQRPAGVPDPTGLDADALEDWFKANETKINEALDSEDGGFTADTFASRYGDAYQAAKEGK